MKLILNDLNETVKRYSYHMKGSNINQNSYDVSGIVTSKIIKRNTHTQNSWTNGGRVHSSPQFIRDSFVSSASEPHFRSKPKTFRVEQDKSVTLPCYVDNLGKWFSITLFYSERNYVDHFVCISYRKK